MFESITVQKRLIELQKKPFVVKNSSDLLKIHRHLFQDVYDWAGEPRKVEISKSGINGDLHNLLVGKKRTIQKDFPKLKDLILEHCVPLSELFHAFMDDDKSVKYVLNNLKTAWITKEENAKLNKKYKSARFDWKKCYTECGIDLEK